MAKRKKSLKLESKEEIKESPRLENSDLPELLPGESPAEEEKLSDTEALKKEGMLTEGTYKEHLPAETMWCSNKMCDGGKMYLVKKLSKIGYDEEYYKCDKCRRGETYMLTKSTRKSTK